MDICHTLRHPLPCLLRSLLQASRLGHLQLGVPPTGPADPWGGPAPSLSPCSLCRWPPWFQPSLLEHVHQKGLPAQDPSGTQEVAAGLGHLHPPSWLSQGRSRSLLSGLPALTPYHQLHPGTDWPWPFACSVPRSTGLSIPRQTTVHLRSRYVQASPTQTFSPWEGKVPTWMGMGLSAPY